MDNSFRALINKKLNRLQKADIFADHRLKLK